MIIKNTFGRLKNGRIVTQYTLKNQQGTSLDILTLGGIIRRFSIPVNKQNIDIVLGFDNLDDYLADASYLGALVGRYANRIAQGQFKLGDIEYQVGINQAGNCLHGGPKGFNSRVWQANIESEGENPALSLTLSSEDGDQGFPGQLEVKVLYTLTEQNRLKIEYFAKSEQDTVFNPTNHAYFNLAGHNSGSVVKHQIAVAASHFTPTNDNGIPTGDLTPVAGTPFDSKTLTPISQALASSHLQIKYGNGLDHNFCLDQFEPTQKKAIYAAQVVCTESGLSMQVSTSMPGLQVFTANHFADMPGKEGAIYQAHQGVCFESQFYPDSPNQPDFPSAFLKAGEEFYSVTEYQITTSEHKR